MLSECGLSWLRETLYWVSGGAWGCMVVLLWVGRGEWE